MDRLVENLVKDSSLSIKGIVDLKNASSVKTYDDLSFMECLPSKVPFGVICGGMLAVTI
jgi:hypothetical protein